MSGAELTNLNALGLDLNVSTGEIYNTTTLAISSNFAAGDVANSFTIIATDSATTANVVNTTLQVLVYPVVYTVNTNAAGSDLTIDAVCEVTVATGDCTFAAAYDEISNSGGGLIRFSPGAYNAPAHLNVSASVNLGIDGGDPSTTSIDATANRHVFVTAAPVNLNIANIALQNGSDTLAGSIYFNSSSGSLFVANTLFNNNQSTAGTGGAIEVVSALNVDILRSKFSGNSANGNSGGAIQVTASTNAVNIHASQFSNNSGDNGGAVSVAAPTLNIKNSTFNGNSVGGTHGGAVYYSGGSGAINVVNSTFYDNHVSGTSGLGGAIYVGTFNSAMNISHSTFVDNATFDASSGGAIAWGANTSVANINASLFAGNEAAGNPDNVNAGITSTGDYNLADTTLGGMTGTNNNYTTSATDLELGGLQDNDSVMETISIGATSDARDLMTGGCANDPVTASTVGIDQRGQVRPLDAGCDVGAYEH